MLAKVVNQRKDLAYRDTHSVRAALSPARRVSVHVMEFFLSRVPYERRENLYPVAICRGWTEGGSRFA